MPNSLAIIGAGRVGRALGRRLRELGCKIGAVVTRSEPSARRAVRFIGDGKACEGMTRRILASRVILIATPDDEIAVVAQELARIGEEELRGRVVLHTSGAMDSAVLDAVPERGAMVGSMHPLQSFGGVAVPSLEGKAWRVARAHLEKQENLVPHDSGDGRRSCARGGGSRHAIAPLAWDEAERSRARVVASDAPGSGEFRNVRATRGMDGAALPRRLLSGEGAFGSTAGITGGICPSLRGAKSSGGARARKRSCQSAG